MRTLVWLDALKIGYPRIDSEHERLIELAGDMEDLVSGQGPVDNVVHGCDAFLRLLRSHCTFEESLLRKLPLAYAHRVDEHIFDHRFLVNHAEALTERLCAGQWGDDDLADLNKTVMGLMRELLVDDVDLIGFLFREGKLALGSPINAGASSLIAPGSFVPHPNG